MNLIRLSAFFSFLFFFDEICIQAPGKHFLQHCLQRNGWANNPGDKIESDYHILTFGRFHMTSSQITRRWWYAKIFLLLHNSDFFITAYPVNEKCTEDITRWREDMNCVFEEQLTVSLKRMQRKSERYLIVLITRT